MPKTKKKRWDPEKESDYQKLKEGIVDLIRTARAKGIPLFERDDLFECQSCGAYEDVLFDGARKIFLKSGRETSHEFILIDKKETSRSISRKIYFKICYQFICGVCGVHQGATFKASFDQ